MFAVPPFANAYRRRGATRPRRPPRQTSTKTGRVPLTLTQWYALSAGSTTATGRGVDLGPSPTAHANTNFVLQAQRYNAYRILEVIVHLTPLKNQTTAQGQVLMWVTNDPAAGLPTTDGAAQDQCNAAGGVTVFSGQPLTKKFEVPSPFQNMYSTGMADAGGTTPTAYQGQATLMIYVIGGAGTDPMMTINLELLAKFSGPGVTTASAPSSRKMLTLWEKDVWKELSDASILNRIYVAADNNLLLATVSDTAQPALRVFPTQYNHIANVTAVTNPWYILSSVADVDQIPNPPNQTITVRTMYHWDDDAGDWTQADNNTRLTRVRVLDPVTVTTEPQPDYLRKLAHNMQLTDDNAFPYQVLPVYPTAQQQEPFASQPMPVYNAMKDDTTLQHTPNATYYTGRQNAPISETPGPIYAANARDPDLNPAVMPTYHAGQQNAPWPMTAQPIYMTRASSTQFPEMAVFPIYATGVKFQPDAPQDLLPIVPASNITGTITPELPMPVFLSHTRGHYTEIETLPVNITDADGTTPNTVPVVTDEYTTTLEDIGEVVETLGDIAEFIPFL